ncbi:uncharacterized protein LOC113279313 [Papaver somniferum]|uniref:uncharacterized protein LOC113279313 n=1 Tax=Papaver somniferum TaxID=3469 RepID=UPI000E7058B5|nr:uncharacterized protein LOC113279313 [Papaver somniferum]
MISLGKGFFTIKLDNMEDKMLIKSGQWEVLDQVLRVRNWMSNFRPENQRTSKALVWVHYPGLSMEYWDEKTLFTISSAIGTPVKVDEVTLNYENGLYARVLVEIDFATKIPHKLWIKNRYGGFMQSVLLTNLPKFCPHYKIIGHTRPECRANKNLNQEAEESQKVGRTNMGNTSKTTEDSPKPKIGATLVQNMEPFDICEPQVTQINILKVPVQSLTVTVPINSGRFESLQNVDEGEESMIEMLSPTKVLQIVEDNSLDTSVVKYINGKNGSVSEESVPTTSWSKVIQKPAVPTPSETLKKILN